MLISCPDCEAKVDAKILNQVPGPREEELDGGGFDIRLAERYSLLECTACGQILLAHQQEAPWEEDLWSEPQRVYPPEREAHHGLPVGIRESFRETLSCHAAGHYTATALLCRRTLEMVCKDLDPTTEGLFAGLKKLRDEEKIDRRLFEWADALRKDGNFAAHRPAWTINKDDATDLVHFTAAILDYVFILTARFEAFSKRRAKKAHT